MSDQEFEFEGMTCEFSDEKPGVAVCEDPETGEVEELDITELE